MAKLLPFFYRLALAPLASMVTEAAIAETGATALEHTYLERAAIAAADRKCTLFTDGERMALASGLFQARNELLRADYRIARIEALTDEVGVHARSLGCEHTSVQAVASTVRDSYRQFVKTNFLEFPGRNASWEASRSEHDAWATRQVEPTSGAILGLRRVKSPKTPDEALQLAVSIPAVTRAPSAAQLFIRDPAKLSEPWLGNLTGSTTGLSTPPRSVSTPLWAGREANEWDVTKDPIYVFYFGRAAIERIEALDPREAVMLELTPSPRASDQKPQRITFEAGDFAAAHYFAQIPKPAASSIPVADTQSVSSPSGH